MESPSGDICSLYTVNGIEVTASVRRMSSLPSSLKDIFLISLYCIGRLGGEDLAFYGQTATISVTLLNSAKAESSYKKRSLDPWQSDTREEELLKLL